VWVSWLSLQSKVDGLSVVWPQTHCDGFPRFDLKTDGDGLLVVWPQNHWDGFPGLGLKTGNYGLVIWAQNHSDSFLVWASKPSGLRFVGCTTKPMEDEDGVGHALRSSGMLHVEARWDSVSQSGLQTGGGVTWIVHVALSWRSRVD
jgi:hypothetical protein